MYIQIQIFTASRGNIFLDSLVSDSKRILSWVAKSRIAGKFNITAICTLGFQFYPLNTGLLLITKSLIFLFLYYYSMPSENIVWFFSKNLNYIIMLVNI